MFLPTAIDQRVIERDPQRTPIDCAHDARIARELRTIPVELLAQECRGVSAEVSAGLEVDDITVTVGDKTAIDDDVNDPAVVLPGERPFAARIVVSGIERPASARVAQRTRDDRCNALRRAP